MKKHLILPLVALAAVAISCDDDDFSASGPDREFKTMFRQNKTTNLTDGQDFTCYAVENDINLYWYTVDDVYGYEIRYGVGQNLSADWITTDTVASIIIPGADSYTYKLTDLAYYTKYRFAIRCLSNKGLSANPSRQELIANPHNSSWYGIGDGSHQDNILIVTTEQRYFTPTVLKKGVRTETSITFDVDLTVPEKAKTDPSNANAVPTSVAIFGTRVVNGLYKADYLYVQPSAESTGENATAQPKVIRLSDYPEILETGVGSITVDGLTPNTLYNVALYMDEDDAHLPAVDRAYNSVPVRTKGGDPAVINISAKGVVTTGDQVITTWDGGDTLFTKTNPLTGVPYITGTDKTYAIRIDHILQDFMSNTDYAEGSIFKLEPGGVYFCSSTVTMSKGFQLVCDDPNNKAKVYMGLGVNTSSTGDKSPNSCNWSFGRNPYEGESGSITVESIVFKNIDFECELAVSYEKLDAYDLNGWKVAATGTGNYFINQYSEAMPFELEGFEVYNCSFKNFIRGWMRVQGIQTKVISKFIVDGSTFSSIGMYKVNGQGYAFISCNEGTMSDQTNLFSDFHFTNNTVIDFPGALFATQKWTTFEGYWNIDFSNNTIVNPSCYKSSAMFDIRQSVPSQGMTMKCHNNLFVLSRHSNSDARTLTTNGFDIRKFENVTFDVANNYSTARYDVSNDEQVDDVFWSTNQLGSANRGAGAVDAILAEGRTTDDAKTKVLRKQDGTPMFAEDVFVDGLPLGDYTEATPADNLMHDFNMSGFKFKQTDDVLKSPIYTIGVGASTNRP